MITKEIIVNNDHGIHARPSMLLAKIVQASKSSVQFINGSNIANGNSTLELLSLAACKNSKIIVQVSGDDEIETINNIEQAFVTNFEQAY